MEQYTILSGESYIVFADSEDEAIEKTAALILGDECPCGDDSEEGCNCVEENETLTICID